MSNELPRLPLDTSDFPTLRNEGYVYVDKTRQIHQMLVSARYFFLSRPRRFGKSLTVSTLKHLFLGRRELFQGLWIGENDRWDWTPHPVVVLDFNLAPTAGSGDLNARLVERLQYWAQQYEVSLAIGAPSSMLGDLIHALEAKYQQPVVILVDEYDKPLIDHLGKGEEGLRLALENRDTLKRLFGVLKADTIVDKLRLVFITGVSRFSSVSIFSELNNLNDLSMDKRYADLVGWTEEELRTNFPEHIAQLAGKLQQDEQSTIEQLAWFYNGYRFTRAPVQVFNPYCLAQSLYRQSLDGFWFRSGTPSFLVRLLKEHDVPPLDLESVQADVAEFDTFDLENLNFKALLFQAGYLTIRDYQDDEYTLGFPNQEVRSGFYKQLLLSGGDNYLPLGQATVATGLRRRLDHEDLDGFIANVRSLFAAIPYQQGVQLREAHFHALFYMMLALSGMRVHCELLTSRGRIDLAVAFPDKVYCLELKCGQSATDALAQIDRQGYLDRYAGSGRKRIAIGINFDFAMRNICEWKHQVLCK
ncbi:MAG: AAA family ATPase [Pseudomonadota bacterium]